SAFWRGRQGSHQELLIVRNHALGAESGGLEARPKRLPGALAQCRMVNRVIDLEQVFRKPLMQLRQCPCGVFSRVHGFRHLPDISRDLSVSSQVVDELRIRRAESTLDQRTESGLGRWPRLLDAFVPRQQSLEVRALEFR